MVTQYKKREHEYPHGAQGMFLKAADIVRPTDPALAAFLEAAAAANAPRAITVKTWKDRCDRE